MDNKLAQGYPIASSAPTAALVCNVTSDQCVISYTPEAVCGSALALHSVLCHGSQPLLSLYTTGIGAGAGAAIFGYLAHTSTRKERTGFFSMFMAARQIGLILGGPLRMYVIQ